MADEQPSKPKKLKGGKWQYYKVEGDKTTTDKKNCPRCERGVFLASHKDRFACGRCGYTEFLNRNNQQNQGQKNQNKQPNQNQQANNPNQNQQNQNNPNQEQNPKPESKS